MKINHLAIWVNNIELMKEFYCRYFKAAAGKLYKNSVNKFQSYFLHFKNGCRLELMKKPDLQANKNKSSQDCFGLNHFAISTGSKKKVIELTNRLREDGYQIISEPRTTGDGYFESCILDPEDNRIEITI